jgi:hypothetical protein
MAALLFVRAFDYGRVTWKLTGIPATTRLPAGGD